jgi:hypothetical protein
MLEQCERAFDELSFMFLFSQDWHDRILPMSGPVQDFEDYGVLDEHERIPEQDEWAAGLTFSGPVLDAERAPSFDVDDKSDEHQRNIETMKRFSNKGPLIDVVVQKPSDRSFANKKELEKNWQRQFIEAGKARHRTAAGYTLEVAGKKREMCLVFGDEGLMAIYIPQSEVADVWTGLIEKFRQDKRYRGFYAEQPDGEFNANLARILVHSAWVDEERNVAVVAYVTGLKTKGLLASKQRYGLNPNVPPFVMYTSLVRRTAAFKRFRTDVRPMVLREADRQRVEKDALEKAKAAQDSKDKTAQEDLIRMLQ